MTDFKWLEDIVAARTPGKWLPEECDVVAETETAVTVVVCCLDSSNADRDFIATMGTVADLLMDVVRASDRVMDNPKLGYGMTQAECDLTDALEALKQAGEKT